MQSLVYPPQQQDFRSVVEQDYSKGAITVVYNITMVSGAPVRTLLFAVVELLPPWVESEDFQLEKRLANRSNSELTIRRVTYSSALECLKWYEGCRNGVAPDLPATANEIATGRGKTKRLLEIKSLGEEPEYPNIVFANKNFWDENKTIWGRMIGGYRWHQLRALTKLEIGELWKDAEIQGEAKKWLRENLPFDLFSRPLAVGSIHLVLPNPVFRGVKYHPSPIDPTKMLVRFFPAPGRSVLGLTVHLREDRPGGVSIRHSFEVTNSMMEIAYPHELHAVGLDVVCPRRGLLFHSEAAPYIKGINIGLGIITRQRVVNLPQRSKRRGPERLVSPVVDIQRPTHVGEVSDKPSAISVIATEAARVKSAALGDKLGQRWFDNEYDEAGSAIRDYIAKAKHDIFIVDPYFGQRDLLKFALAVSDPNAKIRILSSAEYLRQKHDKKKKSLRFADSLFLQLISVKKQDPSLSGLEIRVMPGKRAEIHDRFIKTPDEIFHLGSSLNEFGSRGTATMRIPNPYPIEEMLEAAWVRAARLEDFVKQANTEK